MSSQTEVQIKVSVRRFVNGRKEDVVVPQSEFESYKTQCEHDGDRILRWEPIRPKAIQILWREFRVDGQEHALQVVDYCGEFLLRHYIGRNDPIELALGLDLDAATPAYNEYVQMKGFPEKCLVDDLALYAGHIRTA